MNAPNASGCAALAACTLLLAACTPESPAASPPPPPLTLTYVGQAVAPYGFAFDGTTVGGLSGISYDRGRGVFYVISDDRSAKNPVRFYTVRIPLTGGQVGGLDWIDSTPLLDRDGAEFPPLPPGAPTDPQAVIPPDPEGIAFDPHRRQLHWTSEGARDLENPKAPILLDPWVRSADMDGSFHSQSSLPAMLEMSASETGPRQNISLEGLTLTPSGRLLFAGMEGPTFDDGPVPTHRIGALTRLIALDPVSGTVAAQYAYPLEPISGELPGDNGVSDLAALNDQTLLVVERSFTDHNVIRLYRASIADADDVARRPSLAGSSLRTVTKELVADLSTMPGIGRIDNIEGITLGPKLPDGRQTVVLVSDDNFSEKQVTQFLVFAMDGGGQRKSLRR